MDNDSRIKDIIYKRRNGFDIINDPEAIASCKREQSRDVIDNARLGSYDKFGNYVIIPEIKRELINMPKLIYNQYSSGGTKVYELKSTIPVFNDVFMKLVISGDSANLVICEQVNREAGGYLEVYDEVIDSLSSGREDRLPMSIIFRNYNIYDNPNDFGKEYKNGKFDNLLTRKVYLSLLSKELRGVSTLDEKEAFKNMVSNLKQGGEYGNKVLDEFLGRLKDRPAIFEISKAENYNKAMNEVLLSSLEVATTEEDRNEQASRQVYLSVLNERDKNIEKDLLLANERVSEEYVKHIVDKAKEDFIYGETEELSASDEFYSKLNENKSGIKHRTLEKPILKQGKQDKLETKEDKIKQILEKNKTAKKTPAGKKLSASKSKKTVKKLKTKNSKKASNKKSKKVKRKVKAKIKAKGKKRVKAKKPKAKKRKLKKAKLKSKKKKLKKAKPLKKKKLGKKKSAKKKVRRKLAKRKLKVKKGKLKSKKKKLKKSRNAKKARKKVGALRAKKSSFPKPQKFSVSKSATKKKKKVNMAVKMNILDDRAPVVEKGVSLSFKLTHKPKFPKAKAQTQDVQPEVFSNLKVTARNSVKEANINSQVASSIFQSGKTKDKQNEGHIQKNDILLNNGVHTERREDLSAKSDVGISNNENFKKIMQGLNQPLDRGISSSFEPQRETIKQETDKTVLGETLRDEIHQSEINSDTIRSGEFEKLMQEALASSSGKSSFKQDDKFQTNVVPPINEEVEDESIISSTLEDKLKEDLQENSAEDKESLSQNISMQQEQLEDVPPLEEFQGQELPLDEGQDFIKDGINQDNLNLDPNVSHILDPSQNLS